MLKKIFSIFLIVLMGLGLCACNCENESVVRIHIRANSNSECDQAVKLLVRNEIVAYITPLIASCENAGDVKNILYYNLDNIERIADEVLNENGFKYVSNADVRNEYFPTRDYDGVSFPADYYDALIVELGSGVGDNWWCVAYPPLCFVGEDVGISGVRYKSKLVELINKFFG